MRAKSNHIANLHKHSEPDASLLSVQQQHRRMHPQRHTLNQEDSPMQVDTESSTDTADTSASDSEFIRDVGQDPRNEKQNIRSVYAVKGEDNESNGQTQSIFAYICI